MSGSTPGSEGCRRRQDARGGRPVNHPGGMPRDRAGRPAWVQDEALSLELCGRGAAWGHDRDEDPAQRGEPAARSWPCSTSVSSAHSGSAAAEWPQPRGQSSIAGPGRGTRRSGRPSSTCASPNERMPGVSITHPPRSAGSGSASADDDVCRPLPTPLTAHRPVGVRHQRVDQRRLADPGVPDQRRDPAGERLAPVAPTAPAVAPGDQHRQRPARRTARANGRDRRGRTWSGTAAGPGRRRRRRPGSGR